MRLDHLLSKELLTAVLPARYGLVMGCQCCPLRRRLFCGGCSWVEYQRIKLVWHGLYRLCPGASTAACAPFWGCGVVWKAAGAWWCGVVFGALLGPEATGPFCSNAEGHFWCFFCSCSRHFRSLLAVPFLCVGVVVVGVWLTGLLFENYIVDASI